MKLLLDTNILLRFLFEPRKLSRAAVRRIESAQAGLCKRRFGL